MFKLTLSYLFYYIWNLKTIRRTIDKKTVDVYQIFIEDLNTVKREITAKAVTLERMHPQYAGAALWAKGLKRRIEKFDLFFGIIL
jgi:dynein heavy chain